MPPKLITLEADNITRAAELIIDLLEDTDKGGDILYFHGWDGWGASVVLKEVVKRLRSSLGSAEAATEGGLEKIIHIDFSRWQSKRALQKAIAEELELPEQVMALFDQCDEEDDFDGVEQSARGVIPLVKLAMMKELDARRFLLVLHNCSGSYIDVREIGVPLIGELSKRMIWTSLGRFWPHATEWLHIDEKPLRAQAMESAGLSDVAILAQLSSLSLHGDSFLTNLHCHHEDVWNIMYAEIEEIAKYTGIPEPDMSPNIVTKCVLYMALRWFDRNISWESHASNYWVCDGIISDATNGGRSAWEISDALQRNMNLRVCNDCARRICTLFGGAEIKRLMLMDRWVAPDWEIFGSPKNPKIVPPQATSYFWTAEPLIIEGGMFEHSDRTSSLRVIYLSRCTFSFSSPPFLSCSNLRFLLLDHCRNSDAQDLGEEKESHHHSHYCSQQSCFWKLWVLELSYTDWYWLLSKDMLDIMVDLRELNVKGTGNRSMMHLHRCSGAGSNSRRLIKLRVVADDSKKATSDNDHDDDRNQHVSRPVVASLFFPDLSSWHMLKTVILDGCGDLEQIDCNTLPLSLESFTLISSVTSSNKIKRISFRGCAKLKNLLLRGLFDGLVELDMSGTTIRTLDLCAAQAWGLKRLFLLGCEKLCAIVWPQEKYREMSLEILHIDTTTTTYAAWDREEGKSMKQQEASASDSASISKGSSNSAMVCGKDQTIIDSDSYICIRDPRLFRSLVSLRHEKDLHVEISSTGPGHKGTTSGGCCSSAVNAHKPPGSLYTDVIIISTSNGSNSQTDDDADNRDVFKASLVMRRSMWLWGCPPIPEHSNSVHCYISIQDEAQNESLLQGGTNNSTFQLINRATTLPALVSSNARTLHLHDSLSITCLPGPAPSAEADLDWSGLEWLEWCRLERCPNLQGVVFNAPSILCMLETFWASQLPKARYICDRTSGLGSISFVRLVFLHLDYCPRLVYVLPLYTSNTWGCCSLETLEIVCCGDLRVVFPSDLSESQQQQEEPRRKFFSLRRIHLYELPKLQSICGHYSMWAPRLETVKIRGCWSLKRLPAVWPEAEAEEEEWTEGMTPLPMVDLDCEKEWWDNLQWDGEDVGHCPSHYKPTYSAYNKKNHVRASVLR